MKSSIKNSHLIIFGTGSLSELVTAFLEKETDYTITGFTIEREFKNNKDEFLGRPLVDFDVLSDKFPPSDYKLFIAVGNNYIRKRLFTQSKQKGYSMISHVTESVTHWDDLEYGENVLISGISSFQPFVKVGHNTIIFGSKIGHHTTIGNHVMMSCSTVGGGVKIGDYSFLGLNSAVQHDTVIGSKNIIGMGCNINFDTNNNDVYTTKNSTIKRSVSANQISEKYL